MSFLALSDARWSKMKGGYNLPYDVSIPLKALATGANEEAIWLELWEELHHQGNVGEASYAAIPSLVDICIQRKLADWNLFHLANVIEVCRKNKDTPNLPAWLEIPYHEAWIKLFNYGLDILRGTNDELMVKTILATIAIHKKQSKLARIMTDLDESELNEFYDQMFEVF
jgi:hypothetical protein